MLMFCAPGLPAIQHSLLRHPISPNQPVFRGALRRPPRNPDSSAVTTCRQPTPSKVLMSLKGLSYAAAAIVLSTIPNSNPHAPSLLPPAQASETHHIASAPQRFSQSFTLEEPSPMKLDPHWDVHSLESKTETFVMFTNDSSHVVDIWWVDYYGKEIYYASVRPGTSHMQPSYATHPWVVRDHISQNSLLVLVARDNPAQAIVNNII